MLNPFVRFRFELVDSFRQQGKRWLVAQRYFRCEEAERSGRPAVLLTHYSDSGLAKAHLKTLDKAEDKYACIIDLGKETHRKKVAEMIAPGSNYLVYASLIEDEKELQFHLRRRYKMRVRRYIAGNLAGRIRFDGNLEVQLDTRFGVLYLVLKYDFNEDIWVKLDDIEKS